MIIKIDASKIYSMDGKLILGNKYKRVEGNLFETGFNAVTIATGSKGNNTQYQTYYDSPDGRVFYEWSPGGGIGQPDRYTNSSWGLRIFYEVIRCEVAHSTSDPVMETNTSDFYMDITVDGNKTRVTHTPSPIPSMLWTRPSSPASGLGTAALYVPAAESLIGKAAMTVVSADYYNAVVDVGVITKVEIWQNIKLSQGGHLTYYSPFESSGEVEQTAEVSSYNFNIFNNTFFTDSNPYELGDADKKYTYKYADNLLITENSIYNINEENSLSLIQRLFGKILENYDNGKQVVTLSISEGDYIDKNGNKLAGHIFEVGQYVELYDDTTPLIYYKLSNICKLFEIMECEYINEQWNLVLKEVAKVELD